MKAAPSTAWHVGQGLRGLARTGAAIAAFGVLIPGVVPVTVGVAGITAYYVLRPKRRAKTRKGK